MPMSPEQEKKLDEVHTAIVGNKNLRQKGIIERVEDLEQYKSETKLKHAKQQGIVTVIGIVLTEFGRWIISPK